MCVVVWMCRVCGLFVSSSCCWGVLLWKATRRKNHRRLVQQPPLVVSVISPHKRVLLRTKRPLDSLGENLRRKKPGLFHHWFSPAGTKQTCTRWQFAITEIHDVFCISLTVSQRTFQGQDWCFDVYTRFNFPQNREKISAENRHSYFWFTFTHIEWVFHRSTSVCCFSDSKCKRKWMTSLSFYCS